MSRDHWLHGGGAVIEALVTGFLTSFGRDALIKIALRVNEAHADQRQSEVAGLLAMVARENSQASGVNRQRYVQPKFGRKIGDRVSSHVGMFFTEPRPPR